MAERRAHCWQVLDFSCCPSYAAICRLCITLSYTYFIRYVIIMDVMHCLIRFLLGVNSFQLYMADKDLYQTLRWVVVCSSFPIEMKWFKQLKYFIWDGRNCAYSMLAILFFHDCWIVKFFCYTFVWTFSSLKTLLIIQNTQNTVHCTTLLCHSSLSQLYSAFYFLKELGAQVSSPPSPLSAPPPFILTFVISSDRWIE